MSWFRNKGILLKGLIMWIFPWNKKVKRRKSDFIGNMPRGTAGKEGRKKEIVFVLIILFSIVNNLSFGFLSYKKLSTLRKCSFDYYILV